MTANCLEDQGSSGKRGLQDVEYRALPPWTRGGLPETILSHPRALLDTVSQVQHGFFI